MGNDKKTTLREFNKLIKKLKLRKKSEHALGVNLITDMKLKSLGVHTLVKALGKTNIPFNIYKIKLNQKSKKKINLHLKYSINFFLINPKELIDIEVRLPKSIWEEHKSIGIWDNEIDEIPNEYFKAFSFVDEVWSTSQSCAKKIAKKSPVPVKLIPHGIYVSALKKYDRKHFRILKDKFVFLTIVDMSSVNEIEKTLEIIKAYKKAFKKEDNSVCLILKILNPNSKILSKIKSEAEGYKNIIIIKKSMSYVKLDSLIKIADVYVSFNSSERIRINVLKAMAFKVAVLSTHNCENIDFVTTETACCVDGELIGKGENFSDNTDLIQAAVLMKILKADNGYREFIRNNAYKNIKQNYSIKSLSNFMYKRIMEIANNIN